MDVLPKDTAALEIEEPKRQPDLTYALDLEGGHIRGKTDGAEAIAQAIAKALITKRNKSIIYDSQYGSELYRIIQDKEMSRPLAESEIDFAVKDALKPDERILSIDDLQIEFKGDSAHIKFVAETEEDYIRYEGEFSDV